MSKCVACNKDVDPEFEQGIELLTPDGDFACSKTCADKWRQDRDYFFEHIITDEKVFLAWITE